MQHMKKSFGIASRVSRPKRIEREEGEAREQRERCKDPIRDYVRSAFVLGGMHTKKMAEKGSEKPGGIVTQRLFQGVGQGEAKEAGGGIKVSHLFWDCARTVGSREVGSRGWENHRGTQSCAPSGETEKKKVI